MFRDFIQRHFCCCWVQEKQESIKEAQERMILANESFLSNTLTDNPSNILVKQVMMNARPIYIPEPIPEVSIFY